MDNRNDTRTDCRSPVHFISARIPYRGCILNVSKRGMLIQSNSRLEPGAEVKLCYSQENKISLDKGIVAWSSANKLGIKF